MSFDEYMQSSNHYHSQYTEYFITHAPLQSVPSLCPQATTYFLAL